METRYTLLWTVFLTFTITSLVFVSLRVYSRLRITKIFLLEDYLIVLAQMYLTALCALSLYAFQFGGAIHNAPVSTLSPRLKYGYIMSIVYLSTLWIIKISILLFYRRLSPARSFHIMCYIMVGFVSAYSLAATLSYTLICHPVQYQWLGSATGTCGSYEATYYSAAAFNIISDFIMLILPMPIVLRVRLPTRKKIGLAVIFLIGGVAAIASVVRLYMVHQFIAATDQSWYGSNLPMWSLIECSLGIISSSIPAIRPLVVHIYYKVTKQQPPGTTHSFHDAYLTGTYLPEDTRNTFTAGARARRARDSLDTFEEEVGDSFHNNATGFLGGEQKTPYDDQIVKTTHVTLHYGDHEDSSVKDEK
ncbi:uncharacterized protein V1510DRAFT_412204 [Dipodascopsis tothii]|uniref:uncharacterized protein n=1 Tax=Dipodascopsis tothii TaxID=44089 RepID=UPI0034CFE589